MRPLLLAMDFGSPLPGHKFAFNRDKDWDYPGEAWPQSVCSHAANARCEIKIPKARGRTPGFRALLCSSDQAYFSCCLSNRRDTCCLQDVVAEKNSGGERAVQIRDLYDLSASCNVIDEHLFAYCGAQALDTGTVAPIMPMVESDQRKDLYGETSMPSRKDNGGLSKDAAPQV